MPEALILALAALLLGGLLYFENKESLFGKILTKTPLSVLFIVVAVIQPHPHGLFYIFILLGLIFCLGGDVFLAIPSEKTFLFGLVSFLLGHVFYIIAFVCISQIVAWADYGALVVLGVSAVVYLYLRPHLGKMVWSVLAYVVVISLMVIGAWAVFNNPNLPQSGRNMVLAGAILFYLSDLFVARDRFLKRDPANRFIGLPMYYDGQYLLAFSVGMISLA